MLFWLGIPLRDLRGICYKLYFFWQGVGLYYKRNSVEFSVKIQWLRKLIKFSRLIGWFGIPFFKRVRVPDALRVFGWISRNWDPIKNTRWLLRVDLLSQGVTLGPYSKVIILRENRIRILDKILINYLLILNFGFIIINY